MKYIPILYISISALFLMTFQSCSDVQVNCDTDCTTSTSIADSLKQQGNINEAIKLYKLNYNTCTDEQIAYKLAYSYAINNNIDSSFIYLNKAIDCDSAIYKLYNGELYNIISDTRWKNIENKKLDLYEAKFGKIKNRVLTQQLLDIGIRDQAFYYEIEHNTEKNWWELRKVINEKNLLDVINIIEESGWPTDEIALEVQSVIFLVFQHSFNLELMNKYSPLLKNNAKESNEFMRQYAFLTDRISKIEDKEQLYGSQISYDSINHTYYLYKVKNIENLNKRRIDIGLSPIEDYLKIYNAEIRDN